MPRSASPMPEPLAKAARRFAAWRRSRTSRRIPEELWSLAARLGARYGVSRTARALRIQYYDLKKRVPDGPVGAPAGDAPAPSFVEILTAPSPGSSECVVEMENAAGEKMRVELRGATTAHLLSISRLFLEQRS